MANEIEFETTSTSKNIFYTQVTQVIITIKSSFADREMRPKRAIYSSTDLKCFIDSSSYARLNAFIRAAADAITGVEAGVEMLVPEVRTKIFKL